MDAFAAAAPGPRRLCLHGLLELWIRQFTEEPGRSMSSPITLRSSDAGPAHAFFAGSSV
jgi:hypothetical protein